MFKSTTARETSIERNVWAGKHSTGREQTDVDEKQALNNVEKRKRFKETDECDGYKAKQTWREQDK